MALVYRSLQIVDEHTNLEINNGALRGFLVEVSPEELPNKKEGEIGYLALMLIWGEKYDETTDDDVIPKNVHKILTSNEYVEALEELPKYFKDNPLECLFITGFPEGEKIPEAVLKLPGLKFVSIDGCKLDAIPSLIDSMEYKYKIKIENL